MAENANNSQLDNANHVTQTTVQKPAQFDITFELEGFPVVAHVEGKAESLMAMVKRLKEIGAKPPTITAPVAAPAASASSAARPTCPTHGAKLKESRKPGEWYCPKKDGDEYCDFKWKEPK